jgi:hypothetical protein
LSAPHRKDIASQSKAEELRELIPAPYQPAKDINLSRRVISLHQHVGCFGPTVFACPVMTTPAVCALFSAHGQGEGPATANAARTPNSGSVTVFVGPRITSGRERWWTDAPRGRQLRYPGLGRAMFNLVR